MQRFQEQALVAMAFGRIGLGIAARVAPTALTRAFGGNPSPELDYMNRVFGSRAFALGSGYLLSDGDARRLWQRLAFVCDVSDTVAGIGDLRRKELGAASALATTLLTGSYAAIGAARVLRDVRPGAA